MIEHLLWTVAGAFPGFFAGICTNVKRVEQPDGKVRIVLTAMPYTRAQRAVYIAIGAVAAVGAVMTAKINGDNARLASDEQQQAQRQQVCNNQLIAAINARAGIAQQDTENLQRLLSGLGTLVLNPAPPTEVTRAQARAVFADYLRIEAGNELQRKSHPLPSPECGK